MTTQLLINASVVAIDGRALMIEGPAGSGKSSLALALIDRGADLIGDDGAELERVDGKVFAAHPPHTAGLLEIRGVGLIKLPTGPAAPLALILTLGTTGDRLPAAAPMRDILGCAIPALSFVPGAIAPAQRAEWALRTFGLVQ